MEKGPREVFSATSCQKQGQLWDKNKLLGALSSWVWKPLRTKTVHLLCSGFMVCLSSWGKYFLLNEHLNLSCFELWPIVSHPPHATAKNLSSSLQSLHMSSSGLLLSVLKASFLPAKQTQLPQPPLAGPVLQPPPSWWPSTGLPSTHGRSAVTVFKVSLLQSPPRQRLRLLCHICDNPRAELRVWTVCV